MYTDFIQYRLADGASEQQLMAAAKEVLSSWMSGQEGFVSWQINKLEEEGLYLDVVQWESKEAAKKAEANMQKDLAADNAWYKCYDFSSISAKKGVQLMKYL